MYLLFSRKKKADTLREEFPPFWLLSIKPIYARHHPPFLLIQQTSCPASLRPILVLKLCISSSSTFTFLHIHSLYPFLSRIFNLSLELDHSQRLENMHPSFRLKGEMPSTPHLYPALSQSLSCHSNFSKALSLLWQRWLLAQKMSFPSSNYRELVAAQTETVFPASLSSTYGHGISSTKEIRANIVGNFWAKVLRTLCLHTAFCLTSWMQTTAVRRFH